VLAWREEVAGPRGRVVRAFTDRRGGVSAGAWATLNLGGHVEDDATAVRRNRETVAAAAGATPERLLVARQVHGAGVVAVDGPWPGEAPEADGMVTATPGLVLAVLVADCVPVLLAAPTEGVVAVAHAGRRGMDVGVVGAVLDAMARLGAGQVVATLGPSVCARCYAVPVGLRDDVAARHPVAASVGWHGEPALDVAAGVLEQLRRRGVAAEQVPGCTVEDADLYSYRRDGTTGRFAGLAWVEAP
jgi:polyphenol oxidase